MDLRDQEAPHSHLVSTFEPGDRYKILSKSDVPRPREGSLHGNSGLQETELETD